MTWNPNPDFRWVVGAYRICSSRSGYESRSVATRRQIALPIRPSAGNQGRVDPTPVKDLDQYADVRIVRL